MSMGDSGATVIDGKAVAKQIREEIAMEISRMKEQIGTAPGLAVILVGARKDSQTYVRNKKKACEAVGIASFEINLPEDCTEEQVIQHIDNFNSNPSVHGILIQLPLPRVCVICVFFCSVKSLVFCLSFFKVSRQKSFSYFTFENLYVQILFRIPVQNSSCTTIIAWSLIISGFNLCNLKLVKLQLYIIPFDNGASPITAFK